MVAPSAVMLAAAERVALFMQTRDDTYLAETFSQEGVTIIDNFPPHVFHGEDAVGEWAAGFRRHADGLADLQYSFGTPCDATQAGDTAFFTLPTTWTGTSQGKGFSEEGGWAFVLSREGGAWRVKGYGWAVTRFDQVL